ncbi:hypothetical protein [Nocardiopsis halophila]|uniref:hypothetical protein n=1 Tax=Nocardiopsis halophila TaxID=141692 RepID=UPI00034DCE67|nr:hypothetical protein [Nocardiopsis halophila]
MTSTGEPPVIRRRDVVAAEVTKIVTNPVSVLVVIATAAVNTVLAAVDASGVRFYTAGASEPATLSSFSTLVFAPVYIFLVLPVYAAAGEHREGQLRISLLAVPDRRTLVLGKMVAMVLVVLAAATVAIAPARLIMGPAEGAGVGARLLDPVLWTAAYAFMSVIAFGLAGLLRGAVTPLGILITVPVVIATGVLQWPEGLRLLPDQAALSLVGTPAFEVHEIAPGIAALVLCVWSIASLVSYALAVKYRDA